MELLCAALEMRKGAAMEGWMPRMLGGLLVLQVGEEMEG